MSRRLPVLAVLAVVASLVTAACSPTPTAPALTDPREILDKGAEALATAKTFHLKAAIDGSVPLDLTGSGTATPLDVSGTTLEGDVDAAGKKTHLLIEAPALLGATGEFILVDDTTYSRISLRGPKFSKTEGTTGGAEVPTDPTGLITGIKAALDELPTPPTKNADVKCGDTDCYSVTIALTSEDLSTFGGDIGLLPPGMAGVGTIEFWVRRNDLRPARIVATVDAGSSGKLAVTLDITSYDAAVTIAAPPADQVEG